MNASLNLSRFEICPPPKVDKSYCSICCFSGAKIKAFLGEDSEN